MPSANTGNIPLPKGREINRLPVPDILTATQNTAGAAVKTVSVTAPAGFMYKIKGALLTAGQTQTIGNITIRDADGTLLSTIPTANTRPGATVRMTKMRNVRNRFLPVTFKRVLNTAAGAMFDNFELPMGVTLRRAYATVETTPGAGKTITFTFNAVAILVLAGAITAAEVENLAINVPADTDMDIALTDNSGAANGYQLTLVFEINDNQADFEANEHFPLSFYRNLNAIAGAVEVFSNQEMPEGFVIERAYATCETAPGAGKNVTWFANGIQICQVLGALTAGENEVLNLSIPPDQDVDITITDDAAVGNGYSLSLVCKRATPLAEEIPADIEDIFGEVYLIGGDVITFTYTDAVGAQAFTGILFCAKTRLMDY
jgi:hypothetical protein